jgi:hypothetical protein
MLEQKTDTQFQDMIDSIYVDTSNTLMEILMKKYKLMDHFNALRRYLLLGCRFIFEIKILGCNN